MAIAPIGGIGALSSASGVSGTSTGTNAVSGSGKSGGSSFMPDLKEAAAQLAEADKLGQQLATGELQDLHTYMAAATKAQLSVSYITAIRDRGLEAYQEVMRMQV